LSCTPQGQVYDFYDVLDEKLHISKWPKIAKWEILSMMLMMRKVCKNETNVAAKKQISFFKTSFKFTKKTNPNSNTGLIYIQSRIWNQHLHFHIYIMGLQIHWIYTNSKYHGIMQTIEFQSVLLRVKVCIVYLLIFSLCCNYKNSVWMLTYLENRILMFHWKQSPAFHESHRTNIMSTI